MTAEEWSESRDPEQMGETVSNLSPRKLRLAAIAVCHFADRPLPPSCEELLSGLEQFADGMIGRSDINRMQGPVRDMIRKYVVPLKRNARRGIYDTQSEAYRSYRVASACDSAAGVRRTMVASTIRSIIELAADAASLRAQLVRVLRDVFGNPFRPVTVEPSWLTSDVVGLAAAIYADRAFDRLPILADALEEAGCDHPNVLDHCRGPGPHVRGCWVVDLLLGKK